MSHDDMQGPSYFTEDQREVLFGLNVVSTGLSFLTSIICLIAFAFLQKTRTFYTKVIVSLIMTDFLFSIGNIVSLLEVGTSNEQLCFVSAVIKFAPIVSNTVWVFIIVRTCFLQISIRDFDSSDKYKPALIFNLLYSLLWTLMPIITTFYPDFDIIYGLSPSGFCQIFSPNNKPIYFLVFVPQLTMFLGTTYYSIKIALFIKEQGMAVSTRFIIKTVMAYPIIIAIIWTPSLIDLSYEAITTKKIFGLLLCSIVFAHSQGFMDGVYFLCVASRQKNNGDSKQDDEDDIDDRKKRISMELYRRNSIDD